jgi:hypothetical protein
MMVRWSSVLVVLAGVWTAIVPFVGPALGLGANPMPVTGGMQHQTGMATAAGPLLAISASTLWYHLVPGAVATLVGIYQLVAPLWTRGRAPAARQQQQAGATT